MPHVEQAGAIPFTVVKGQPKILLVKAKQTPTDWIFPKGHIEPGESPETTAVRELREEAGVLGAALRPAGALSFKSGQENVRVQYFLVRYAGEPRGGEPRERKVFDIDGAIAALAHPDARKLLERVRPDIERYAAPRER